MMMENSAKLMLLKQRNCISLQKKNPKLSWLGINLWVVMLLFTKTYLADNPDE